jgi:hypothetical protein
MHPTRIFASEADLQAAWIGYKDSLKDQSKEWTKVQYVGKDGDRKEDAQKVPYTLEGFKRFCRENHGEVEHYFSNTEDMYKDFCGICSRIREEIRENQIVGGLLGFYNPSITQRLNNLQENIKTDQTVKIDNITGMEIK